MVQVNQIKTEELLKGLKDEGIVVGIENIDKYLHQAGVLVKLHIGRIRGNVELTPSALGVNVDSEGIKTFFTDYVKNGSISFIPQAIEKEFRRIEDKIRKLRLKLAIGYDGSYMPIQVYEQFKQELEKAKEEYFEQRDFILSQWDDLKVKFFQELEGMLSQLNPIEKDKIFKSIARKYPSREEYAESFYMRTSLKAFPVVENLSLLDEEMAEEVRKSSLEDNLNMVHELIGVCLNEIFVAANAVYRGFDKNRKLSPRTIALIKNAPKAIRSKNLLKHPSVDALTKELEVLGSTQDPSDAFELAEEILAKAYGEAMNLQLVRYLNLKDCDLSVADLEVLARAYAI